jgi:hypothetical protein
VKELNEMAPAASKMYFNDQIGKSSTVNYLGYNLHRRKLFKSKKKQNKLRGL